MFKKSARLSAPVLIGAVEPSLVPAARAPAIARANSARAMNFIVLLIGLLPFCYGISSRQAPAAGVPVSQFSEKRSNYALLNMRKRMCLDHLAHAFLPALAGS